MNLYIQIDDNGNPINHPAFEDNLLQAFGNIPSNWKPFIRVERPQIGIYQKTNADPTYELINGVWMDVWAVRDMTEEEKENKRQRIRQEWEARPQAQNWSAWTLNESTLEFDPPIPRPEPDEAKLAAGIRTFWCGAENNWKDSPALPRDGKAYNFNFFEWTWVEVTT